MIMHFWASRLQKIKAWLGKRIHRQPDAWNNWVYREMVVWAAFGNPYCQMMLARLHESGSREVPKDRRAAYFLYCLAAEEGDTTAIDRLVKLEPMLTFLERLKLRRAIARYRQLLH